MTELTLADLPARYAFCDPSGGKPELKKTRARSAIVCIAADHLTRIFVLVAWAARCSTDKLFDEILAVNAAWKPRIFGIEANAMQTLFADAVRREAKMKQVRLPLVAVQQSTKINKEYRIRAALQPVIAFGRLFTQPTQHELIAELTTFPMSQTKDLADALASAVALVPPRATRVQRDEEAEQLAAYLRESGAPAWYIRERMHKASTN